MTDTDTKKAPVHNPILKIQNNKATGLRAYINAMCAYCMGCTPTHLESGFRKEIKNCTSKACPLHKVRPHQEKSIHEDNDTPPETDK